MVDRHAFDLSIVLLTEDGAKHAHETLEAIVRGMLLMVEATCRMTRIDFFKPSQSLRDVMQGNQWRSRNPKGIGLRDRIVLFGRFVAEKLLEGHLRPDVEAPGFVFFHFDGDHGWQDRHLTKDEKVADLEDFLRRQVIPPIDRALHKQREAGVEVDVDAGRKAALLRLRRLTPFYSIEAWLFQNTVEAQRLCSLRCGKHMDQLQQWRADRGKLDEFDKPKDELPCIEAGDHVALAETAFPAGDVYAAGKSYAAAVDISAAAATCAQPWFAPTGYDLPFPTVRPRSASSRWLGARETTGRILARHEPAMDLGQLCGIHLPNCFDMER